MNYFYAKLVDNVIVNVIVVPEKALWDEKGIERNEIGVQYCQSLEEGQWMRTYPTAEKHKWFGGVGFTYRPDLDAFIPPKPPVECTLDEELCHWIDADGRDLNAPPPPRSTEQHDIFGIQQ